MGVCIDSKDLIQLTNELVEGLFSVNVSCIDQSLSSFQTYYKHQLPPFLSSEHIDNMAKKLEIIPPLQAIAHYQNSLSMNYVVFSYDRDQFVVLGPYLVEEITEDLTEEILHDNNFPISYSSAFHTYFDTLPICQNTDLIYFAQTMIRKLRMNETDPEVYYYHLEDTNDNYADDYAHQDNLASIMPLVEKRYEINNKLFLEVSFGNTVKAKQHYKTLQEHLKGIKRINNPIRNKKNLHFVLNTILRMAAEKASVHPIYLDRISSHYAIFIESSTSSTALDQLGYKMVEEYCKLVQKYSLKSYSPVIRKTINYIHVHLSDPLTLDTLAQNSNVSASYLSRQFNKEVHESIPNYINRIRVKKAAQMLQFSHHSVQEIGEYVGFYDLNYFTKIFKKYYDIPPIQYQKEHSYY